MNNKQMHLLYTNRFLPLFITQFLGAFNDSIFKAALISYIGFFSKQYGIDNGNSTLIIVAAGMLIFPFFLFSATAGQLADKYEKSGIIRKIKFIEIIIIMIAIISFANENITLLLITLFLMGTQSTFFGPLKYGILPQHLKENELISGNGFIEMATFIAILVGTILGGLTINIEYGLYTVGIIMIICATSGYIVSRKIPIAEATAPYIKINPNIISETKNIMQYATQNRDVFLSILGISWFWLIGLVFLTEFLDFAKFSFNANEQVYNCFIAIFSIGIGFGSLLCNKLLKGEISAKYVPLAAIGMSVFTLDLFIASPETIEYVEPGIGIINFLSELNNWRIIFDLFMIAVLGGLFIVPLYSIMQSRSEPEHRSRVIAANNIINALFMSISVIIVSALLYITFSVPQIFLTFAILNIFVAIYICRLLPTELIKIIGRQIFRILYRIEIKGMDNYKKAGERVVIVANHASFLDPTIIGAFLPDTPIFAVNSFIAKKWWVKPAFMFFDLFSIDPSNPISIKTMVEMVKNNRKCVIFPEGRITVTGALMKIYEGPGTIADMADAHILPIRIDGAQYTPFSRMKGKLRLRLLPKITITILEPQKLDLDKAIKGRERRAMLGRKLYDLMANMIFTTSDIKQTLFCSLIEASRMYGRKTKILEDIERNPMNYNRLIAASFTLGSAIDKYTNNNGGIGLFLPNSVAAVVTFFALQSKNVAPAMLNYSAGVKNIAASLEIAQVKTVITSRRFIKMGQLQELADEISEHADIIYLEDLKNKITKLDKLIGLLKSKLGTLIYKCRSQKRISPDDAAVILFTSGSEGVPKGVVLSHSNIQANRHQFSSCIDFNQSDVVFNALPIFHAFGLTAGTIVPVLSGIKQFLYPPPLHYKVVPELVYDTDATIMYGTDTFLSGYAKSAHPYDFYSIRYVFAGAEKLKVETRRVWSEKFGIRILEGYGATETAPVLTINTPNYFKPESVGRFLPGIRYKLENIPGIKDGGRLWVKGPNIMQGYLKMDSHGKIIMPEDGWYDTGDIVSVDEMGFVTIKGRAKRFAKIAGEMISLTAAENFINSMWPDYSHAIVSIPDKTKGEKLVLITEKEGIKRGDIITKAKEEGIAEIMVPREISFIENLPLIGTGKVDYVRIKEIVADKYLK